MRAPLTVLLAVPALLAVSAATLGPLGCGDPSYSRGPAPVADAGPGSMVAHCTFEKPTPTAGAGGTVTAGEVRAGTAEVTLDIPIGATLGAYASRANITGNLKRDGRVSPVAGRFLPSVGIESAPKAKVLALEAGGEPLVLVKLDLGVTPDGLAYDVATALGNAYAGKVIVAAGHSHAAWGHLVPSPVLTIGFGLFHRDLYGRVRDQVVAAATQAIAARVPAKMGIHHDSNFDPDDRVSHDRRSENDSLMGGRRKDRDLFVLRVDTAAGNPLAIVPIFGVHGTTLGDDNDFASRESSGAIEQAVEESFEQRVLVMHLQGAAGDVSPAGRGSVSCSQKPCPDFARVESVGREARSAILAAWENAGRSMRSSTELEVVTRSIVEGPEASTFAVRGGGLTYAPFDLEREADGRIWAADGKTILSPIDEFNAPAGAALCGDDPSIPGRGMPGTSGLPTYGRCVLLPSAYRLIQGVLEQPLEATPLCSTTRTVVSAVRIGDFLIATLPGEPVTLLADTLRARSPLGAAHTAVVGYAQSHVGYLLTAEDWLSGGFEPSINVWGPLEGEHILEGAVELLKVATTPIRENAEMGTRVVLGGGLRAPPASPSPTAGSPLTSIPPGLVRWGGTPPDAVQPATTVARLQNATFVFEGSSPLLGNPEVRIEREVGGNFVPLLTRSGRPVADGEVLLTYTPFPLTAKPSEVTRHYYAAEWQVVTPRGVDSDRYATRLSAPTGRYRFVVAGTGLALASDPFAVVPSTLDVKAARASGTVTLTTSYDARGGYRLLDDQAPSNGLIPARESVLTVQFTGTAGAIGYALEERTSAAGTITVTAPAGATHVTVRDAASNAGTTALP